MATSRNLTARKEIVRAARRSRAMRLEQARRARWSHRMRRLRRAFLAAGGILLATLVAALVVGGLPFTTTLLAVLAAMVVFAMLCVYPASPRPHADQLGSAELPELAASTELWLESRRRQLPTPALDAVDMIGVRLEQLQPQLATMEDSGPAAREVRKLLGEHLPALVDSYTRIPPSLRGKAHAGSTPDAQLVEGLGTIAEEIEAMSLDLSQGDLDALATRGRFLETKYIDARIAPPGDSPAGA